ncbi:MULTISPECIES: hypothetical protein [unclassified Achromobacter]|uniref:hypothetical protein n=1 Tax=unclassified Achromobacter TaxID=2626865 RepID=UPI000B51878D|nr:MULTISPECIES: hypothetical protein [unclassified Achromobacter]OWT68065.1 hypothetical protein CEY05_28950 [Achromobacter sp. HZ34]OWT69902.1 hypothetical protein CEY04_27780 [Achromobacter sp. HZ28]
MTQRSYPYTAWVLKPSFKPSETTFVEGYSSHIWHGDISDAGKYYPQDKIYPTKAEAITHAEIMIQQQEEALIKKSVALEKRRAAITKAKSET